MSVQQMPTGEWFYRFQVAKETVRKQGFRTRTEAEKAEAMKMSEMLVRQSHGQTGNDDLKLNKGCDLFFEEYAVPHKRRWKEDRTHIAAIKAYFGERRIREINPRDVEAFRRYIHKTMPGMSTPHVSLNTVNHYHAALKAIINWLKKRRLYYGENPAWGVPMARVPKARVRFLSVEEERRLTPIVAKHSRLWPFYVVGLHTGMRIGEICEIRVRDFVRCPKPMIFIPNSKTSRSRYVPLSDNAAQLVATRAVGQPPEARLLDAVRPTAVNDWLKECCYEAQVMDFTFHCLRHTFAGFMLGRGVPIYKVSKMLGHSTVVTTEQHYGHLDKRVLGDEIHHIEGVMTVPKVPGLAIHEPIEQDVVNEVVNGNGDETMPTIVSLP